MGLKKPQNQKNMQKKLNEVVPRIKHFTIAFRQTVQQRKPRSKSIINFLAYTAAAKIHIIKQLKKLQEMVKQNQTALRAPEIWTAIAVMLIGLIWFITSMTKTNDFRQGENQHQTSQATAQEVVMTTTTSTGNQPHPQGEPIPQERKDFFSENWQACRDEEQISGIPAEIKLAQMSLETNDGKGKVAKTARNYFGIKCFSRNCPKGHCINFTDDSHKDFFVVYNTKWESIRAHTELLKKDNYKNCHKCTTLACWADELKNAGYATSPTYATALKSRINQILAWQREI